MESLVSRANVTGPRNMIAWHPPIDSYNRGRIIFIKLHPCFVTYCRRLAFQVLAEVAEQNVTGNVAEPALGGFSAAATPSRTSPASRSLEHTRENN